MMIFMAPHDELGESLLTLRGFDTARVAKFLGPSGWTVSTDFHHPNWDGFVTLAFPLSGSKLTARLVCSLEKGWSRPPKFVFQQR